MAHIPRPRRRIRVRTRRCWTHHRLVSQLRRNHARTTRRRGNADKRAIIGIERESDRPTGFPLRRFRRFHNLTRGRLLVGERNPWSNQLSGLALLLESFPCGVFNVEGSARDASGPLPAVNREAGNSVANSLAPRLFGRRQVQVRAFQSFLVANRVRHFSRTSRSADVGCWFSVVCNFLEGSGGRRNLLGQPHSTPCQMSWLAHGGSGAPKAREQLVAEAALAGGMAALVSEMSAPQGAGNSWGHGTSAKAMVRRIKRERSAASTADVKREVGPPPAKKSKGKSDGKGGKNKRARYTVDQDGVQLCFSWNFGGELSPATTFEWISFVE